MLPWWLAEAAGKANGWGRRSNPALRRRSEAGEGIPGASPSRRGSGKPHAGAQPLGDPVRERAQRSGPAGAERTQGPGHTASADRAPPWLLVGRALARGAGRVQRFLHELRPRSLSAQDFRIAMAGGLVPAPLCGSAWYAAGARGASPRRSVDPAREGVTARHQTGRSYISERVGLTGHTTVVA